MEQQEKFLFQDILNNKIIINYYLTNTCKYVNQTIYNYWYSFKKIVELSKIDFNINNLDVEIKEDKFYNHIVNSIKLIKNVDIQRGCLNNFIRILYAYNEIILKNDDIKNLIIKFELLFNKFSKLVNTNKLFKAPTKKELENKIKYSDLFEIRKEYEEKFMDDKFYPMNDIRYVLLTCYIFYPLRQQDFINTTIYDDISEVKNIDEVNYIILSEKKMYVNNYKTMKTHGKRIIDLSDDFYETIKRFVYKSCQNKLLPQLYNYDKFMIKDDVTRLLSNILKIKAPIQMLRKCYISEFYENGKKTGTEIKKLCNILGHTPSTSMQTYNKFNIIADGNDETQNIDITKI